MAQVTDPTPSDDSDTLLCCYVNATSKIQIARVSNVPNWYFERVVFPGQRLLFEAVPAALLEIHTGMMASAILSDTISCLQLRVEAVDNLDAATASRLAAESVAAAAAISDSQSAVAPDSDSPSPNASMPSASAPSATSAASISGTSMSGTSMSGTSISGASIPNASTGVSMSGMLGMVEMPGTYEPITKSGAGELTGAIAD
jgi:hypothetical protein